MPAITKRPNTPIAAARDGDLDDIFVDLILLAGSQIDQESPVLARRILPGLFLVTCLASDPLLTGSVESLAFERRFARLGDEVIRRAADHDAQSLHMMGSFLLWELDDLTAARPYLEAATASGHFEATLDLFVLAIFEQAGLVGAKTPMGNRPVAA